MSGSQDKSPAVAMIIEDCSDITIGDFKVEADTDGLHVFRSKDIKTGKITHIGRGRTVVVRDVKRLSIAALDVRSIPDGLAKDLAEDVSGGNKEGFVQKLRNFTPEKMDAILSLWDRLTGG